MLAGRKPFRGEIANIIVEHASKQPPPLRELCPDVPPRLAEAVHRALAKKPEDRFATCGAFAAAVLAKAPLLKIDTSRARLLCPSCRAILRVPMTSAGKRGNCPRCRSSIVVADDLGSLWLSGEDTSSASLADELVFMTDDSDFSSRRRRSRGYRTTTAGWAGPHWTAVMAAVGTSFVIGIAMGRLATGGRQTGADQPRTMPAIDQAASQPPSLLGQLDELTKSHLAEVEELQAELTTTKASLDTLTAENRRLKERLTQVDPDGNPQPIKE
jgi:Zn-finger nucleic acid-binding protein